MKLILKIAAGVVLGLVLLTAGCGALIAASADDIEKEVAVHQPSLIENPDAAAGSEEYPGETVAQENARRSAESYLDTSAFSRIGLIKQLKFEGYSTSDATYAVDAVSPNWNQQAAKSAENYLDTSSFSRSGLIQQLEFEGYTEQQAVYGVNKTGL
jgi:colicin import membrane protein